MTSIGGTGSVRSGNVTRRSRPTRRSALHRAFTLLELLVVVGLIAALSCFLLGTLTNGNDAVALRSAQASVASLMSAARTHATASGVAARVVLNVDPTVPERYLRCLALQRQNGAEWETITTIVLPGNVGVLPRDPTSPGNLLVMGTPWTRPSDGTTLRSSALRANSGGYPDAEITAAIDSPNGEQWAVAKFSALGTTLNTGDIVLVPLRRLPPGSYSTGESPVQFINPESTCGLTLSSYGLASLIDSPAGF